MASAERDNVTASDSSKAKRVVGFVFVTVFLDLVGFGIVIPLFPFYVKSMGGTAETIGYILASFSFTQLVATPFLGRLSDRVGRRPVILLSLAGNAASMLLFALATHWSLLWLLFASRIMAGATAGNIAACQAAIADVTTSSERAKGMGRLGAGMGLGMVLGPFLGGTVSHFGGWAPPLAAGGLALADVIAAFFFMPETNDVRNKPKVEAVVAKPSLSSVLSQRALVVVLALYFLTFLYMTNIQVSLALLTNARLGWGEKEIGKVFGGFGLIMLLVQGLLIGRMTRVFGARNIVIAGSFSSMLGLVLIAQGHEALGIICGLALLGLGLGVVNPCLSTIAADQAGAEQRGAVLGVAQSAGGLARTVGPLLFGSLYARISPAAPFLGGAGAAFGCLLLAFGLLVAAQSASARA